MFTGTQIFGIAPRPRLNAVAQIEGEALSFLTKAVLALDPLTLGNMDTILEATDGGTAGNSLTIALVHSAGAPNPGALTRLVNAFTFTYKGGTTTVGDFEAAVTALAGADDLIAVKTAGTGGDVLHATNDVLTATALAGGLADNDTVARKFPIDKAHGMWSVQVIIPAGTFTGSVDFYYSNLPYPDPDNLTHWIEDTDKDYALSDTASSVMTFGVDKIAEHGLCVVTLTAGSCTVAGWATAGSN